LFHAAVGAASEMIEVPKLDFGKHANFGGLGLRGQHDDLGQEPTGAESGPVMTLNTFPPAHFIKVHAEGMEIEVLDGALAFLDERHPVLSIEHTKVGEDAIKVKLSPLGYKFMPLGAMNLLCVHGNDPLLRRIVT